MSDEFNGSPAESESDGLPMETKMRLSWAARKFILAPSSRFLSLTSVSICVVFALAVVLSFIIKVDVSLIAYGEVTPIGGVIDVSTASAGKILKFYAQLDEDVQTGQVIAELEMPVANRDLVQKNIQTLNSVSLFLQKKGDFKNFNQREFAAFLAQTKFRQDLSFELNQTVSQLQQNLTNLHTLVFEGQKRAQSLVRPLKLKQLLTQKKLKQMRGWDKAQTLNFYIEKFQEEDDQLSAQIRTIEGAELNKIETLLSETVRSVELAKSAHTDFIEKRLIRAPLEGKISKISSRVGAYANTGFVVAEIIQKNTEYIAELKIDSKDISKIEPGQNIFYRVESYPYQLHGSFKGQVVSIDKSAEGREGLSTFIVRGSLTNPARRPASNTETEVTYKMAPGMKFNADVVLSRKSIAAVLFKKIFTRN